MKATATFSVKKWEENTYAQSSPTVKMTKASVEYALTGELEGTAFEECLMFYSHFDEKDQHNSTATYIGLIRFEGKLGGRAGSFVMKDEGTYESGSADSLLTILKGSGTGDLKSITGTGMYQANKEGVMLEFDYVLGGA